ncbi:MAG: metal ABC transporter solute-binding protein, Zn/Mn family [Acholeplasmataceae bacterium]
MRKACLFVLFITAILTLAACDTTYDYVEGKVNVVATTTMLGDLSERIGGEHVSVTTLMDVGVDPHLYSPKASDTNALDKSDFIVFNGLNFEGKMVDILETLSQEKPYLNAGEALVAGGGTVLYDEQDSADPHIWFNVENWIIVAEGLTAKLMDHDPANADYYADRGDDYVKALEDLQEWTLTRVRELTEEQRILVTAHDAFGYFARAYGFEVEAIQGMSTESEASISDINRLVDLVISREVRAIFIENSVPQKTVDSVIAAARDRDYTLVIGGELYSDSLGDGDNAEYINAFKTNVNRIVDALK